MKYFLIISLISFILNPYNSYADSDSYTDSITINWNQAQSIKYSDSSFISRLSFDGAFYGGDNMQLPFFVKTYRVNSSDVDISIENKIFEELSLTESLLINKSDLKNELIYKYNIGKSRSQNILSVEILPLRLNPNTNKIEKLIEFSLLIDEEKQNNQTVKGSKLYKANSVLSSGNWYKIKLSQDGMYKITGSELSSMGFSLNNLNINHIHLYGNGGGMNPEIAGKNKYDDLVENAIKVFDKNNNGVFDSDDYFIFFGKGPDEWKYNISSDKFDHLKHIYDDFAYYFITVNSNLPVRINQQSNTLTENQTITSYRDYIFYNRDSLNLIKSGRTWYARKFDYVNSYSFSYVFPNIIKSKDVKVTSRLAARSTVSSSNITVNLNNNSQPITFPPVSSYYTAPHAAAKKITYTFPTNSDNLNLKYTYVKPNNNALAYLDYFEIEVERELKLSADQQLFRSPESVGNGKISKFIIENTSSQTSFWDITDRNNPVELDVNYNNQTSQIIVKTDSLKEIIAFNPTYKTVTNVGSVANQNLHKLENIDYIIIYHPTFADEANFIADYHRTNSNLSVETLTQDKIFNEFSSGAKDPAAIRDFMKMLYDRAEGEYKKQPKYLLFVGDGSYDNKSRVNNNTDFIITYQSNESLDPTTSFVTEDYFGLLDDNEGFNANGHLDIGIGRIPVKTKEEAQDYIKKMKRYINEVSVSDDNINNIVPAMGDWRNNICFVADDEDNNIHISQSDNLATKIDTDYRSYNVDKIYFDAYTQTTVPGGQRYPQVKTDLLQKFKKGALLINYIGHGGEAGLAHESVLEVPDILKMDNKYNLAVFITATCEFSRFDDPERTSAGEYTFLNNEGGAIALLTTTRLAYSGSNFSLNTAMMNVIFEKDSLGNYPKLGDLVRLAKVNSGSWTSNRNFMLIGDPALQISYPKYDVVTTEINNAPINGVDTIKALTKITIKGQIENDGVKMTDFNGVVYPTVFDKEKELITLANDNDSYPFKFKLQKNILYKGKSEVKNGEFEFTFIVPKDIAYNYDTGKISYYATDGEVDANGYYNNIIVGGSNNNPPTDSVGPVISLYMNDSNFVAGGITDESPILLSFVYDESGINTTGNGIGHDIVAVLDENTTESIVLNDYYQADLNSYQSGVIRYPFRELSEGEHSLSIKVWDIYNNSAQAKTYFIVASSENVVIDNLFNYPNPFSESTTFTFEHNQVAEKMLVEIYVYNLNGQLQKTIKGDYTSNGFRLGKNEIVWDGRNDNGHDLDNGVYIYQLRLKLGEKPWEVQSNKLVIYK